MFSSVTFYSSQACKALAFKKGVRYLLMIAQGSPFEHRTISSDAIHTITVPAVMYKGILSHDGMLCCELSPQTHIVFCQSEKDAPLKAMERSKSIMLFVHWLDPSIYHYLDKLFSLASEEATILGVGCGRTDGKNERIMTCNAQALTDGFLVLFSERESIVGAHHGSSFFQGYYSAFSTQGNHIVTIDAQSAFDFYAQKVKTYFNEELTKENIFSVGLRYPLGLASVGEEHPLRVPSGVTQEGALIVAGPMDEESALCLMRSETERLSLATQKTIAEVKEAALVFKQSSCFVVECLGRHLLLQDRCEEELENIASAFSFCKEVFGVLSLGEIANNADKYIEYFNESCVIGVIDAPE